MTEHQRTGPYEDGSYRYRGWTLTLWEDCREGARTIGLPGCNPPQPLWIAMPSAEVSTEGFHNIANEAGFDPDEQGGVGLSRHADRDPFGTIEEAIDLWEAGRERLFREAFAQAVREP